MLGALSAQAAKMLAQAAQSQREMACSSRRPARAVRVALAEAARQADGDEHKRWTEDAEVRVPSAEEEEEVQGRGAAAAAANGERRLTTAGRDEAQHAADTRHTEAAEGCGGGCG